MPIGRSDLAETLQFDADDHPLARMNGVYHAECAAPFKSVIHALESLRQACG